MSFLLDTNVISELRKPSADPNVRAWFASVDEADLHLSVLVVGEIRQGVERLRRRDPSLAAVYDAWLARLQHEYPDRVIPISVAIAEEWGRLNVPAQLPIIDGLLAATAKTLGFTLVTRNVLDVARTGVQLLNPFVYVTG